MILRLYLYFWPFNLRPTQTDNVAAGGKNKQNQPFLHGNKMKWNFPSGTGGGNLNPPTAECDVERRGRKARLYGSKGPAVRGTGRKTTILKEDVVVSLHGPTDVGQRDFQNSRVDPARPQKREHRDFFSSLREKPKNFHILLWQHVGKIEQPSSSSGRRGLYFTPSSKAPSTRGGGPRRTKKVELLQYNQTTKSNEWSHLTQLQSLRHNVYVSNSRPAGRIRPGVQLYPARESISYYCYWWPNDTKRRWQNKLQIP